MNDIIEQVIKTEISREKVPLIIQLLARWAVEGKTNGTYTEVLKYLGYTNSCSAFGYMLGKVQDVIDTLNKTDEFSKEEEKIPSLNSLCTKNGVPSNGFGFVRPGYEKLTEEEKKEVTTLWTSKAISYGKKWFKVLDRLGIEPINDFTQQEIEAITQKPKDRIGGGEGSAHRELKNRICNNPDIIGYDNVKHAATEEVLPSGDKLDVYFELNNGDIVAVEVKSATSDDDDHKRGIFQCVKYQAVLEAMQSIRKTGNNITVILVTETELSTLNEKLAKQLKINNRVV